MRTKRDWPSTREEAVATKRSLYYRPESMGKRCEHDQCANLYTETQECVACVHRELWETAKASPEDYPIGTESAIRLGLKYTINGRGCIEAPHLFAAPIDPDGAGKCYTCAETRRNSPRQLAVRAGDMKYTPNKKCPRCGEMAPKRVDNGQCDGCITVRKQSRAEAVTPWSDAKARGDMWYKPTEACTSCGQMALRRVNNGSCQGCNPPKRAVNHISDNTRAVIDAMGADYLVDRETAQSMQLTAYRDGKFCIEGHTGWKYLSGGCVTCGGDV